jgi:3-(3-hydroxy-phenyl)propionate hydroxylase/6-hydroxy-3-succinoylpyridine 3-monooxygenase
MERRSIVVAGGGPTGLAVALGLAQRGAEVTVLDRASAPSNAPRALAYLHTVLPGFAELGVLDDIVAEAAIGDGINFIDHDSGESFHMKLDVIENDVPYAFVPQVGQDRVSQVLLRHIAKLDNVEVLYDHEITGIQTDDDSVTLTVSTAQGEKQFVTDWLVGADGASSAVRRLLDLAFEGMTWPDKFVSTNVRADLGAAGIKIANWRIDPVYGAVIARYSDDNLWRFTFKEDAELPDEGLEERIHAHFATAMPGNLPYELVQFAPYRIHQRATTSFRFGRVLLAGDAAHVTNPIGGLGLTGGFLDAFVLSEALAAVVHGEAAEDVLDRYADERRKVYLEYVSPTASMTKGILFDNHPPEVKQQILGGLRHARDDREFRRLDLRRMQAMVTPSVLA